MLKQTMIKAMVGLLTLPLLFSCAGLGAQDASCSPPPAPPPPVGPPPCPTGCTCLGKVYVAGTALWWRRGDCSARYALTGGTDANANFTVGTYSKLNEQYIKSNGNWGYRLIAGADKGWINFQASYLQLEATGASTFNRQPGPTDPPGPHFYASIPGVAGNWARIRASQSTTYQNVTLRVAFPVTFYGGLQICGRYVNIDQSTQIEAALPTVGGVVAAGSVGRGKANSQFVGGGPGLGLFAEAPFLFPGFTAGSDIMAWGYIGESEPALSEFQIVPLADQATPGQDLKIRLLRQSYWVGGVDWRLLLSYVYECGCFTLKVRGAWEIHIFYNSLFDRPEEGFTPRGEPVGIAQAPNLLRETAYRTLVFGGPSITLGATF